MAHIYYETAVYDDKTQNMHKAGVAEILLRGRGHNHRVGACKYVSI